jgi:hypothetical protein
MASAHLQIVDIPLNGIVGPFAERLLREFEEAIHFEGFTIEPESIELGDDVLSQTVALDFRISFANARESNVAGGRLMTPESPVLTFSFSPTISVADNLHDFKEFVKEHAEVAATPPAVRFGATAGSKQPPPQPSTRK